MCSQNQSAVDIWLAVDVHIFKYSSRRFDERVLALNREEKRFGFIGSRTASFFLAAVSYVQKQKRLMKEANDKLDDICVLKEMVNEHLSGKFKNKDDDNIMSYVINE